MPELPEVQTIINSLKEQDLLNSKITDVDVFYPKILKNSALNDFKKFMIGEKIIDIERIGKYLIFKLSNKKVLVVHLRMEGKFFYENNNNDINKKHVLVSIHNKNKNLIYYDTRRFGTFEIYYLDNYLESKSLKKLALDPLNDNFNFVYLKNNINKSSRYIKSILLDQTVVAGIGNIYADEILFYSKISPLKKGKDLTEDELKNIVKYSRIILIKSIENKGTTVSSYYYKKDQMGEFQKHLKVHMKKNYNCENCGNKIIKTKVNGRGTYTCPICQKMN